VSKFENFIPYRSAIIEEHGFLALPCSTVNVSIFKEHVGTIFSVEDRGLRFPERSVDFHWTTRLLNRNSFEHKVYTLIYISLKLFFGSVVVEALYCKPEGRGFETRRGEFIFSIYLILPAALGPGVHSVSNRNEYQKQKNNVSGE
jgi:hypothetical protein